MKSKFYLSFISLILSITLMVSGVVSVPTAFATDGITLSYEFTGDNAQTSGYAQGVVTLEANTAGDYYLYWADDTKALDGYYEIATLSVEANSKSEFVFEHHTAIPAGATRIIAVTDKNNLTVADAVAQYQLPGEKLLSAGSGDLKYRFNSYSDVHIDPDGFYKNYEAKWAQALEYASKKNADFIVSSGDMVNNGVDSEWVIYERILSESSFDNPVYESDGNHDIRQSVDKGLKSFVRATGTDNTIANYDAGKPYYYVKEKTTGDIFIFMALEGDYKTHTVESFSDAQLNWLTNLLETYYGTGVNIYIIEHAPINGFGAGDRMDNPLYKSHLGQEFWATVKFKALLEKYPGLIWMSGHTHIDYQLGYNYSNENGKACNMIHNSAVVGSTWTNADETALDYNDGYGYNSQGYYVEVYKNQVVYYGANLTEEKIYPAYCYIMEGSRNSAQSETNPTGEITTAETTVPSSTGSTLPSGIETKRYYFANTVKWQALDCYSWSDSDSSTCVWPGYGATYWGTDENGTELYYCDVPASHTYIIWNNCGNEGQTVDIAVDGVNNFFTPTTTISSKEVPVTASVWSYQDETDPTETEPSSGVTPDEYETGDVDKNTEINIDDATLIQKSLAKLISLTDEQKVLADVNSDGTISIRDASYIQMHIAKIITEFPKAVNKTKALASTGASSLSSVLRKAKTYLADYYYFASYDQYQAVKKLYGQYKNLTTADSSVVTDFENKLTALKTIVDYIGCPDVYALRDTYYFVNKLGWSEIYGYAWTSDYNKAWPGLKLEKCGTHQGYDVYGIKFSAVGEYENLIFNNGSGTQTVDISLYSFEGNCFTINSGDMTDGKYNVDNFQYNDATQEPTAPDVVVGTSNYILRYYNGSAHGWDAKDTYFTAKGDGTYVLNFTTKNVDSISCNVYNNSTAQYNCIASSAGFDYQAGTEQTFSLVASSSRGKSITINGLSTGLNITFVYNPSDNTLKISM